MKGKIILTAIIISVILLLAGCSQNPSTGSPSINSGVTQQPQSGNSSLPAVEKPAPPADSGHQIADIAQLLENGSGYAGKEVIVRGKIVQECGSGCWFNLKDNTGVIYVDLAPSNLVIPQKVGSNATVQGRVNIKKGITYIIGTKVEF
jgi:uncharacterized protein YdeI (BOF family)